MKILFPTNSWLYDLMIRSYDLWQEKGIDIVYDFLSDRHFQYFKEHSSCNNEICSSSFVDALINNWGQVDISDKNIEEMEKKYNINMIEMMIYDISMIKFKSFPFCRLWDENYWRFFFIITIEYYENLLEVHSPDFIFGEGPNGMGMKILFEVAKKRRIPAFSLNGMFFEDRTWFSYGRDCRSIFLKYYYDHYQLLTNDDYEKAQDLINQIKMKDNISAYAKYAEKKPTIMPKKILKIFNIFNVVKNYFIWELNKRDIKKNLRAAVQLQGNPFWHAFSGRFEKLINYRYLKDKWEKGKADEKYIIYFLHQQPEASTSVNAPYYENQSNLIENIIKSLPGTVKLYIKPHYQDLGNFGRSFYENLLIYPSVRVIQPHESSIRLLKNSLMAFTISGTVGMEAIMLGKPVGVFCDCYYSFFPGVKRIQSPEDIPSAIHWGLNEFYNNDILVKKFIAAYVKSLYSTKMTWPNMENEEILGNRQELEKYVDGIIAFIRDYEKYKLNEYLFNK